MSENFRISSNQIEFNSGCVATLPAPIAQALDFGDLIVVRLEYTSRSSLNENVFGVDRNGKIAWQIPPVAHVRGHENSPFTNIWLDDRRLHAYSMDGYAYEVNPRTGAIIGQIFMK